MSRLQKKKPLEEKKKKKISTENNIDTAAAVSGLSNAKAPSAAGRIKSKSEKNLTEAKTREPNFFKKAIDFLREVKVELKKVTWPTRKQTTGTTIVVIVFVFVVAIFLGLFDYSLSKLVQVVLT